MKSDEGRLFSRAAALGLLGGGAVALAAYRGGSGSEAALAATACAETPEGEIGPYFADDALAAFDRSNVRPNLDGTAAQGGVPLALTVHVYDAHASCAAMAGVQVDLWHCNAFGVYSDEASEGTATQTWLRGYRTTGATGTVTFATIVPGWYPGRATHIHLRLRSKYNAASALRDGSNTTQLFFPQATIDAVFRSAAPYAARGVNPMTNASDHVFASETKGANVLALRGDVRTGYTATVSLGLPIV